MMDRIPICRALISAYDKTGLADLASLLVEQGVEIVSTGSTAQTLINADIAVIPVEDVTGFAECLDGRVKTLHPRIHAGILADRRKQSHLEQLEQLNIAPFDLVICNFYPFAQTIASSADFDKCIEQIDIGGPSMVRAAAKNYHCVAIITSPTQYLELAEVLRDGGFTLAQRQKLAQQAFISTATYDQAVASWMTEMQSDQSDNWPDWMARSYHLADQLRYGENAHQLGAIYKGVDQSGLAAAIQLSGKAMSYNNYTDADAAYRACYDFDFPCVAIIKHTNPCGIAIAESVAQAYRKALACDPESAYGGVVASNREVSTEMALAIKEVFTEVVVAPAYTDEALDTLKSKKNLRLLLAEPYQADTLELRPISGGLLAQQPDTIDAEGDDVANWQLMAGTAADETTLTDLAFAWRAVRSVKSNAIVLVKDQASVGVGMGQVNRVDACRLAVTRAGQRCHGSVAASDAYFPFLDGPQILIEAGVSAIVEPGGSIRDQDTVTACQAQGVTLCFTATRHFSH